MSRAKTLTSWIVSMLVMGLIGAGAGPIFAEPYQVIDVTDGGTITGVATWKGEVPELPPIEIEADTSVCGEEVPVSGVTGQFEKQRRAVRSCLS